MPRSALFLVALLAAGGCGGPSGEPAERAIGDLAIADSMRISAAEADLTRIGMAVVSPDGDIVVSQPEDNQLKVFREGKPPRIIGRRGGGPGEFENLTRIGWIGDTLWSLDPGLRRTSWFDREFTFIGSVPDPGLATDDAPTLSEDGRAEIYLQAPLPGGDFRVLAPWRFGNRPSWAAGLDSGATPWLRVDRAGKIVARLGIDRPDPCSVGYRIGDKGYGSTRIPFCARQLDTGWDGGASIAILDITPPELGTPTFRVTLIDAKGDTTFARDFPYVPIPVTQAAIDSVKAQIAKAYEALPAQIRDAVPDVAPAATFAPIRRVLLGRDGTVWLEEQMTEPGHRWLQLAPDGRPAGRITLRPNVTLRAADAGTIWASEEDADGLLGIVRFRLR